MSGPTRRRAVRLRRKWNRIRRELGPHPFQQKYNESHRSRERVYGRSSGRRRIYFDRQLRPLKLWAFAQLHNDRRYKAVRQERVTSISGKRLYVSTVWLGIDHGFSEDPLAPPILFETMVFDDVPELLPNGRPGLGHERGQWRWDSERVALIGHNLIVSGFRADKLGRDDENDNLGAELAALRRGVGA